MYGRCDLTHPNDDKLVAISSLAKLIQLQLPDDEYLAGLWKSNLLGQLLWGVYKSRRHINGMTASGFYSKSHTNSQRAIAYRAPSWSWASIDGLVRPIGYLDVSGNPMQLDDGSLISFTPQAVIPSVYTRPQKLDFPLGKVTAGRLVVQGRLYKLSRKIDKYSTTEVFRSTGENIFPMLDEPVDSSVFDDAYFIPLVSKKN
jgi:hypothetical protein